MENPEQPFPERTRLKAVGLAWFLAWFGYMLIVFSKVFPIDLHSAFDAGHIKGQFGTNVQVLGTVSLLFGFFPSTLLRVFTNSQLNDELIWSSLIGGWLVYLFLTIQAIRAKTRRLFTCAFATLCFLLLLNLAGCYRASGDDLKIRTDVSQRNAII